MTEPGMEAVLAELIAEHVRPDEATTGKGDPLDEAWEAWLDAPSGDETTNRLLADAINAKIANHVCGRDCPPRGGTP